MTRYQPIAGDVVLVAIDVAKARNEVLIAVPGQTRPRRLTVINTRAEHDRFVGLLSGLDRPISCGFEATGNYHRPLAWRLLQAGLELSGISCAGEHDGKEGDSPWLDARHPGFLTRFWTSS